MEIEKVKEIKKALQDHSIEKLKYQDGIKIKEIDFIDILTYINELENENEWLRLERDVLIGKKIVEKQKYDNALMVKIDIQKQLKDRIAELEDKIENGTLVELPCKGIDELDIIKKGMIFILYQMCLEQNFGQGFFLKYKSKINEWFESYLKNKELQEEQQ